MNLGGRRKSSLASGCGFVTLTPLLFLLTHFIGDINAQRSFAATKFDLNSNLPVEDLTVAGFNRDEEAVHLTRESEEVVGDKDAKSHNHHNKKRKGGRKGGGPRKHTAITLPISEAETPISIPALSSATSSPIIIPVTASPLPQQPLSAQLPGPSQLPPQPPPAQLQQVVPFSTSSTRLPAPQPIPPSQQIPAQQQQVLVQQPSIAHAPQQQGAVGQPVVPGTLPSSANERTEQWFRDDFDTRNCPHDGESVSRAFRQKFPHNLLRNGKEAMLAELLATSIKECHRKLRGNHWMRVDKLIGGSDAPTTEQEECRVGLIQEQIACMNVLSFSCQFIQPTYAFRLVPTRLIVQEARLAEDGAERCRKFVRKFKQILESPPAEGEGRK